MAGEGTPATGPRSYLYRSLRRLTVVASRELRASQRAVSSFFLFPFLARQLSRANPLVLLPLGRLQPSAFCFLPGVSQVKDLDHLHTQLFGVCQRKLIRARGSIVAATAAHFEEARLFKTSKGEEKAQEK